MKSTILITGSKFGESGQVVFNVAADEVVADLADLMTALEEITLGFVNGARIGDINAEYVSNIPVATNAAQIGTKLAVTGANANGNKATFYIPTFDVTELDATGNLISTNASYIALETALKAVWKISGSAFDKITQAKYSPQSRGNRLN